MQPETGNSVERENQRPSPSWALPISVGSATRREPSPSGGLRRRSGWWRSSKPSRLSFNAGSMIARPRSVHGSGRLFWVIAKYHAVPGNLDQLRIFNCRVDRLWRNVLVRSSQRAQMRWERITPVLARWIPPTPRSALLSRCTLLRHSSFVRAVCVNALVRICAGGGQQWPSLPRQLPHGRRLSGQVAFRCQPTRRGLGTGSGDSIPIAENDRCLMNSYPACRPNRPNRWHRGWASPRLPGRNVKPRSQKRDLGHPPTRRMTAVDSSKPVGWWEQAEGQERFRYRAS
jgi:hypothetical protein